ncbi:MULTISPECIES: phage antirepressor N-terminal domain-containing protein [Pandoraea]|uniref:phage antirepressor N-terminal domain-containing protein n=1 Tax=Pandoraea TaxID=93217 RepID=UPI00041A01FB|nr:MULTISPECIES: phage antirepressor N-terminal domain-containing protein [Pandoraea]AHB77597.2 hypothetical protein X636_20800 [Pandoraea pnomenusa]
MTKNSIQAVNRQISVPFHGANLLLIEHDGQPYTPMKPIVEGMGLDWASQFTKLRANERRWGVVIITIPSNAGAQQYLCIPLRKIFGWLTGIHPGKVKDEIRERVIQYQAECDDVLWKYWTDGVAVNERMPFAVNPDDVLSADQQETLRLMVKTYVERMPKHQQGPAAVKVWSKLKAHFKVTYRQIPQREFSEAVSIVTRTAAEWEVLDAEPKVDEDKMRDAFNVAAEVAANAARTIFTELMSATGSVDEHRWLFSMHKGYEGQPNTTFVKPVAPGASVATMAELAKMIVEPNGSWYSDADLAALVVACQSRLVGRLQQLSLRAA